MEEENTLALLRFVPFTDAHPTAVFPLLPGLMFLITLCWAWFGGPIVPLVDTAVLNSLGPNQILYGRQVRGSSGFKRKQRRGGVCAGFWKRGVRTKTGLWIAGAC